LLAVLAHGWVLGIWATRDPDGPALSVDSGPAAARLAAVSVQVRQIAAAPLDEPRPTGETAARVMAEALPARPGPTSPGAARSPALDAPRPQAGDHAPAAAPAPSAESPPGDVDPPVVPAMQPSLPGSPPPPSSPAPPTYRTAPPPSMDMKYEVRRGGYAGDARITWRIDVDGRYTLEMQGTGAAGAPASLTPHWTSRGALDADGVAPERFAVSRRGRERHAANFRRDAGIVSFAGPARTWPLAAGAQDRLSWIVQLAAVLQAEPALAAAGTQISMMVVGAHGDAGLWTFTVQRQVVVEGLGGEAVPAWLLHRESDHAHDPRVQVWLAPSLHYLPVRLRLTLPRSDESTEMHLRALQAP